jgi:hypothetical protein
MKHGYYTRYFMKQELAYFEALTDRSPAGELILARAMLGRLTAYVSLGGVALDDVTTVMALIFGGIRTVITVLKYMDDEDDVDWDEELKLLATAWRETVNSPQPAVNGHGCKVAEGQR